MKEKVQPSFSKYKMSNPHEYLQSIHQGVGVQKNKKNKLKTRKLKHKNKEDIH